ncbi:hypothetical protein ACIGW4_01520 [Streptomyces sp. NPDC053513]|uniref:hypothetical protein n=1 Tax=unclassified Streptomyces TaxID=2593676 RepID=UPI0037D81B4C
MRAVECAACGNQVLCEKFSVAHTSVQWTADAAVACAEFRDRVRPGATTARTLTCRALRASIDRAVEDGTLTVGTPDRGIPEAGSPAYGSPAVGTPEAVDV